MIRPEETSPNEKPDHTNPAAADAEPPHRDAGRKIVTWISVIASAATVAAICFVITGSWVAVVLPAIFAIAPPLATVFKDEILKKPLSVKWPIAALCLLLLLVTNLITGLVVESVVSKAESDSPETAAMEPVKTGANPNNTSCINDAQIAASANSNPAFLLELIFSPSCQAGWAKVTRRDNAGVGNQIDIVIYRRDNPFGPDRQIAVEPDVNSAFTTLIVRTNPTDRLCAEGFVTAGDSKQTTNTICV